MKDSGKLDLKKNVEKETRDIFKGMSFKYPPVSKQEYVNAYEEYVRRCSY